MVLPTAAGHTVRRLLPPHWKWKVTPVSASVTVVDVATLVPRNPRRGEKL